MTAQSTLAQRIELIVRQYIQACNGANAESIAGFFSINAVQYGPGLKWSGATAISQNFAAIVLAQGHFWTFDQIIIDVDRCAATLEWTAFVQKQGRIVRGVDWFVFEPQTLQIQEIRTYTAATQGQLDVTRQELLGFDYEKRGYPTTFPAERA